MLLHRFSLVLLAIVLAGCGSPAEPPHPEPPRSVLSLDTPSDALRSLPGVEVVVARPVVEPTHRIIHILNWHAVTREQFAADLAQLADEELHGADIEELYDEHLRDVAWLQDEQMALLRTLAYKHGLRAVYVEGLAPEDMEHYHERIELIWRVIERLPDDKSPIEELLYSEAREDCLMLGAAARLRMVEQVPEVLPVEDKALYEAANPVTDGRVEWDDAAMEAREDAIVRTLLGRPVSVVILGGGHDLSDNIERLAPACEYVRVPAAH